MLFWRATAVLQKPANAADIGDGCTVTGGRTRDYRHGILTVQQEKRIKAAARGLHAVERRFEGVGHRRSPDFWEDEFGLYVKRSDAA